MMLTGYFCLFIIDIYASHVLHSLYQEIDLIVFQVNSRLVSDAWLIRYMRWISIRVSCTVESVTWLELVAARESILLVKSFRRVVERTTLTIGHASWQVDNFVTLRQTALALSELIHSRVALWRNLVASSFPRQFLLGHPVAYLQHGVCIAPVDTGVSSLSRHI